MNTHVTTKRRLSILPAASTKVGKISTNSTRREDLSVGGGNEGTFNQSLYIKKDFVVVDKQFMQS